MASILVVAASAEGKDLVTATLAPKYTVVFSEDGISAYEAAQKVVFDIVFCMGSITNPTALDLVKRLKTLDSYKKVPAIIFKSGVAPMDIVAGERAGVFAWAPEVPDASILEQMAFRAMPEAILKETTEVKQAKKVAAAAAIAAIPAKVKPEMLANPVPLTEKPIAPEAPTTPTAA